MNRFRSAIVTIVVSIAFVEACCRLTDARVDALLVPDDTVFTPEAAEKFYRSATGALAPVYPLLAEQIVSDYGLAERTGIGIDIGGGPGTLVVELCKRTRYMYWINADINPHNFPFFYRDVKKENMGDRVGAVFADVHALPFRDNYADIVVSRASFHSWRDKDRAFSEILRVLKPGGVAFIGRGLPDAMPPDQARDLRRRHGHGPEYDIAETEKELRATMDNIGIRDYTIRIQHPPGAEDVNYGIWLEFRKERRMN